MSEPPNSRARLPLTLPQRESLVRAIAVQAPTLGSSTFVDSENRPRRESRRLDPYNLSGIDRKLVRSETSRRSEELRTYEKNGGREYLRRFLAREFGQPDETKALPVSTYSGIGRVFTENSIPITQQQTEKDRREEAELKEVPSEGIAARIPDQLAQLDVILATPAELVTSVPGPQAQGPQGNSNLAGDTTISEPQLVHEPKLAGAPSLVIPRQPKITTQAAFSHSETLKDFRTKIGKSRFVSVFGNEQLFMPTTQIWDLMTEEVVFRLLTIIYPAYSRDMIISVRDQICGWPSSKIDEDFQSFRVIFALLISISLENRICDFIDNRLNDFTLPFVNVSLEDAGFELAGAPGSQAHPCFTDWEYSDIERLYNAQWQFCPPFFAQQNGKVLHYVFGSETILPFTRSITMDSEILPQEGGFSEVMKYNILDRQHDLPSHSNGKPSSLFAVKRIKTPSSMDSFREEEYFLKRLLRQKCDHIVTLLATFEIEKKDGPMLYFLFPSADGTIQEFWDGTLQQCWETVSPAFNPDAARKSSDMARWMAEQCRGLAEALKTIQTFREDYPSEPKDDNTRINGTHGDIKPPNILYFRSWDGKYKEFGILRIADFGLSSYHHSQSIKHMQPRVFPNTYSAPELELVLDGNSSDVWSLGCLYMDFLVWWLWGSDGLKEFWNDRHYDVTPHLAKDTFYCVNYGLWTTSLSINPAVFKWLQKIHDHEAATEFVHDLADLIPQELLVVEKDWSEDSGSKAGYCFAMLSWLYDYMWPHPTPRPRISSEDLEARLKTFVKDPEKDPGGTYYSKPTKRSADTLCESGLRANITMYQIKVKSTGSKA